MRTLNSARLILEPQVSGHAAEMFRVLSDPAIYQYENSPPESVDWLRTRFQKLESRKSLDGTEQWLNWVTRLVSKELIGYVQATVMPDRSAFIAYEFSSTYWGQGLASEAVSIVISELAECYGVQTCLASLKEGNLRSIRLLERLSFVPGNADQRTNLEIGSDEVLMQRSLYPEI